METGIIGGQFYEDYFQKRVDRRFKANTKFRLDKNARQGNDGGVGNTLEDLLGIKENNLPIPNAAEWELKAQRINTSSLTTLFHMEPSPRACRFVPSLLLPKYGWQHELAGEKYPSSEMSFRQTINGLSRTDRGFGIVFNDKERKVVVSFNSAFVDERHSDWLKKVKQTVGLNELNPQPYWGYDNLFHKAATKLINCFYLKAEAKKFEGVEYFHYVEIMILENVSSGKFIQAVKDGKIYVDFDARTGHNHGTKFRLRKDALPDLFEKVTEI